MILLSIGWILTLITPAWGETTGAKIALAAANLENSSIQYIPDYVSIPYPMGDVPSHTGVCTDVVIRAYRTLQIDLQQLVHEDIVANPSRYPNIQRPDTNIDHRRVPNLGVFFKHNGTSLPVTTNASDYLPGDIVWWKLGSPTGLNHIGIVVDSKSDDGKRHLVMHNMGAGQITEDLLFQHHIAAHYRYVGPTK